MKGTRLPEDWKLPEGIDPAAWEEFEQHRKEIRKPLKNMGRTKNANILLKMTIPQQIEAINNTIANGWAGIFPPKNNPKKANNNHTDINKAFLEAFGKPPPAGKSEDECWRIYAKRKYPTLATPKWWNE